MGNASSDAEFVGWFDKAGSDISSFLGDTFGSVTSIFKNLLAGAQGLAGGLASLLNSPVMLIGGGCLVLYLLTSKGK